MRAHLITNSKSGQGKGSTLGDEAQKICAELGHELVIYNIERSNFEVQVRKAIEAATHDGGTVIAAGGDGTVRGVAQLAYQTKVRIAVIPCGTFNFFARTHQVPEDHLEAFRLALTGSATKVRLGRINDHIFLNNASLGLYAKAIREREMRTSRYGRNRIVVIISTLLSLLSKHLSLKVDLVSDGKMKTSRTPMIFIGNNTLQLRDLALDVVRCMKLDLLSVVMMKPITKLEALRIALRGIFKTLSNEERLESFCVEDLMIYTNKYYHQIALDGEIIHMASPFKVQSLPEQLLLVKPPKKDTPA
jgi:diacylglycerol kinase family enzyme